MNNFGLKDTELNFLLSVFAKYKEVNAVLVYGSRAKGNFTERSDIDLVITESLIDRHTIGSIVNEINNSNFPYLIDLQDATTIKNKKLVEHIERVGKLIYRKEIL